MHPNNPHQGRYDLKLLVRVFPDLEQYVMKNKFGDDSINFDDSSAVRSLNHAILLHQYNIKDWVIPPKFLCPPIPSRVDYLHYLAGLFKNPKDLKGLDIGVGANCIYPLVGQRSFGWRFVGSDIEPEALKSAGKIIRANGLEDFIELRHQLTQTQIFKGIIHESEKFDFSLCNPPFHSSYEEAAEGTARKRKNLKLKPNGNLNFGGKSNELWCEGGEKAFILRMIEESSSIPKSITWFTTLVSKEANLPVLQKKLKTVNCPDVRVIEMIHGQKKTRILAWSYIKEGS